MESILQNLRDGIDSIDDEIIALLQRRLDFVRKIGELKHKSKTSIYRPEREREILSRLEKLAKDKGLHNIDRAIIEAIFYEIFAISRNLEMPQKVAFLGPNGSYTHQAAESMFGPLSSYLAISTISAVFDSLRNHHAKYAVIPLENNTNGMVGETIDNLAKHDFKIINEIAMPIHHSLASKADSIGDIKRIYSKDIAFGQCTKFLLHYNLNHIEHVSVGSTSYAASLASSEPSSAAICSNIAAKIHRVPILFENIEDYAYNQTRFIVVSDFHNQKGINNKTSVFVVIKNFQKPGALFELLMDFKEENINITKIDSRPVSDNDVFKSGFYMDFKGHRDDENVARIFDKRKDEIKWLGSYPSLD